MRTRALLLIVIVVAACGGGGGGAATSAPIIAAGTCIDIERVEHIATAEIGRQGAQFELVDYEESRAADGTRVFAGTIEVAGRAQSVSGRGNGLISSVVATLADAFGVALEVKDYADHALGAGTNARAAAYVECALPTGATVWGVGIDEDVDTAGVRAVLSAANAATNSLNPA